VKKDPFSTLAGLDRELFRDEGAPKKTKRRDSETTTKRRNDETIKRGVVVTSTGDGDVPRHRSEDGSGDRRKEGSRRRGSAATGPDASPASDQTSLSREKARHSHDIYADQIRWMNRMKLEVEELYGRRLTTNAIVQMGVDMLRNEYERLGPSATMVRLAEKRPGRLAVVDEEYNSEASGED